MNTRNYFNNFALACLILLAAASFSFAQTAKSSAPRQEKLLNNLKILMWQETGGDKVTVKLRVHSGAAFDMLGKEGTMALLADALFPNPTVKEFFREDLNGSLDVESNYDFIQISATGNADQILTILETVAAAVTKPTLDKETTAKIKAARLAKVQELEKNPAYVADLAVAKRLFGDYPYGRSAEGTPESLAKIDFADLILAGQRFLTADNTTIAVSGNIKYDYVFKAIRQLFGGWEKAARKVPATFAQPNAPDTKFYLIKSEIDNARELRFAFRGSARNDKDFAASRILAAVLQNRLQKKEGGKALLRQNSYFLPGLVILKFPNWDLSSLKSAGNNVSLPENFFNYVEDLLAQSLSAEEFQIARTDELKISASGDKLDSWLDVNSFQLAPIKSDVPEATLADAQKLLERWRREAVVKTLLFKSAG